MRVAAVSIPVRDQDRAKDFYTGVFGFTVEADVPMGDDMRWVMLRPPRGGTAITLVTWFPTMSPGSLKGLVFEVEDIDALHAELVERGFTFHEGIREAPWGRFITMDDPDGNGLVLQQPPAP